VPDGIKNRSERKKRGGEKEGRGTKEEREKGGGGSWSEVSEERE